MTLDDFNRGSQEERTTWTWQQGSYLACRILEGHKIALFYMGEFFAEVYYQAEGNQVDYVRGFKNLELLMPYLDQIHLPDISR